MGRKIPGKKCKRIKDPEKQRAARLDSLKGKVNLPPAFPDVQETPQSLERLIHLKGKGKCTRQNYVRKRRKDKKLLIDGKRLMGKEVDLPGMTKPVRAVPNLNQREGETEAHFLHRVDKLCQNLLKESKFEKKFGVEVCRNPVSGAIEEVRKCNDEVTIKKKIPAKKSALNELKKLNRTKYKKAIKKLSKLERRKNDFDHLSDEVKFGEVVHQPPSLKVLPRKASFSIPEGRPGQKDLILKRILTPTVTASNLSKSGKLRWKDIPVGDKMRIEQRREDVVKAYKMLKAKKYGQGENI